MRVWAMTGRRPNPLAGRSDETLGIEAVSTATVQEAHLLALHLLCELFDEQRQRASSARTSAEAAEGASVRAARREANRTGQGVRT